MAGFDLSGMSPIGSEEPGFDLSKIGSTAAPAAEEPKKPVGEMGFGEAALETAKNIPSSAVKFGHDLIQPIIHPIDTAMAIGSLGHGVLQKTGLAEGDESIKHADAVGQFFKDRYGSVEAAKKSLVEDPVGVLSDFSMVLTGGGSLAARAPGVLGKVGEGVRAAGQAVDPIALAAKPVAATAKLAGKAAGEIIGGIGTHTGYESLKTAMESGYKGGVEGQMFRDNMRGNAPMEDTVTAAREGIDNIRKERGTAYRQQMAQHIGPNANVLNMYDIGNTLQQMRRVNNYKGQHLDPKTTAIYKEVEDAVVEWSQLPARDFHTAEGLDALKRKIGNIMDATKPGTPEYRVSNKVYNSIKDTIVRQEPEYAKIMKGYEKATDLVRELERTLSLNETATVDTILRKLQSTLRDNVNTSFGRRKELAQYLIDAGSPQLMERLAGQALKPWTARGLGKLGMQVGVEMAIAGGIAAATLNPLAMAKAAVTLPAMSPRLMGEAAHKVGQAGRYGSKLRIPKGVRDLMYQSGRTKNMMPAEEQP